MKSWRLFHDLWFDLNRDLAELDLEEGLEWIVIRDMLIEVQYS